MARPQKTLRQRYEAMYARDRMFQSYLGRTLSKKKHKRELIAAYTSWTMRHADFTGWKNAERGSVFSAMLYARYPKLWYERERQIDGIPF